MYKSYQSRDPDTGLTFTAYRSFSDDTWMISGIAQAARLNGLRVDTLYRRWYPMY